ncbi:MAG: BMP family ABC transporter substrate-binding protein, partial [Kofleriaceae bacterium]|nr:BMP family ABC transporter substrate-binding protein [Kofleriaceae bacterium]
ILVGINLMLFLVGWGRGGEEECTADVCVGLVFDVGGLGDKSFNDAAHRGLLQAEKELGIGFRYIEPGDGSDRESALRQLASKGNKLVIGVGFIFSDDLRKLAREFPDTKFACIDYSAKPDEVFPDNLVGLRFHEHEGSFLVGAIAGMKSESSSVGFVSGMDIPLIHKFEAGYRAGVLAVCPECTVLSAYAGTEPKAFADPIAGKEIALAQINRGADVIFHASGKTGAGVFNAAKAKGKWAIGVDSDQFEDMPCCVLTSMIKKVDVAVFDTVAALVKGEFRSGVQEFGLSEEGVSFVYDDNNRDRISPEMIERVGELRRAIIAGEIVVPSK